MRLIQPLLVLGLLAALVAYLVFLRTTLRDRIIAAALGVFAVLAVVFPDLTNSAAHRLGVGRGADLLIYMLVLCGVFGFLLVHARLRRIEDRLTAIVRRQALTDGTTPGETPPPRDDRD